MDRNWFQPLSFPHYDVSLSRRARAVQLGAIEVDRREGYEIRKRIRAAFTDDDIQNLRAALPTYDARHAKLRRIIKHERPHNGRREGGRRCKPGQTGSASCRDRVCEYG